jgi:hypothetical protein
LSYIKNCLDMFLPRRIMQQLTLRLPHVAFLKQYG